MARETSTEPPDDNDAPDTNGDHAAAGEGSVPGPQVRNDSPDPVPGATVLTDTDAPEGQLFGIGETRLKSVSVTVLAAVVLLTSSIVFIRDLTEVTVRVASAILALALVGTAVALARRRPIDWAEIAASLVGAALAVTVFVAAGNQLAPAVGRVLGAVLFATAVVWAVRAHRARQQVPTGAIVAAVAALALLVVPTQTAEAAILIGAATACLHVVIKALASAKLIDLGDATADEPDAPLLERWLIHNAKTNTSRKIIIQEFFFEGPQGPGQLLRFLVLMVCASGIATMGVLTDSTAVVIGAMLVAPLITPMMGMALSLTMGWPRRLLQTTIAVVLGALIAIACGAILPAALGSSIDLLSNTQITSRSSPTVADLIIALIAGATGAYANARRDVASSLPGVAIAIALVPPLAVVGVTAQQGAWDASAGTLLLFLTNLTAILLMGGVVFLVTGVAPIRSARANQHRVRTALSAVAMLSIMVVGALMVNGQSIARDSLANDELSSIVSDWLGESTDFSIDSITVVEDRMTVIVSGPGDPPDVEGLINRVDDEFDRSITVDVQWVARDRVLGVTEGS